MNKTINPKRQIQIVKLSEQTDGLDLNKTTPQERWAMMWQLTLDARAFKGEPVAEPRLQRHIVRVFRRES
jgi:hypothetical protein